MTALHLGDPSAVHTGVHLSVHKGFHTGVACVLMFTSLWKKKLTIDYKKIWKKKHWESFINSGIYFEIHCSSINLTSSENSPVGKKKQLSNSFNNSFINSHLNETQPRLCLVWVSYKSHCHPCWVFQTHSPVRLSL